VLAVLAVICGCTSASCRSFGAETLEPDDVEPPRNSGDAGCYWLLFAVLLQIYLRCLTFRLASVRAGNYHINARKATIRASKLTSAVKRFKFISKVVERALLTTSLGC
jgi:hypothetical protein